VNSGHGHDERHLADKKCTPQQGDQIGRKLSQRATFYYGQFFDN
jgi:hypothetical protein